MLNGGSARDDFNKLASDDTLASSVELQGQFADHLTCNTK